MIRPTATKLELAERQQAITCGGIASIMQLIKTIHLRASLNDLAKVLKKNLPYDKADHITPDSAVQCRWSASFGCKTSWPDCIAYWANHMKEQSSPTISIVTPSYNQGDLIEETITSVLSQDYKGVEYFVIDGGSTDDSVETIKKYGEQLTYWESTPDRGQSHAIMKGFERARGEILGWLNSDDMLTPGALAKVATSFVQRPAAVAWVGNVSTVHRDGRFRHHHPARLGDGSAIAAWGREASFYQPGCFFSREAYEKVGRLREKLHYAMDPDLWMRLTSLGEFVHIPDTLAVARIYPECKSQKGLRQLRCELIWSCIENGYTDVATKNLAAWLESDCKQRNKANVNSRCRRLMGVFRRALERVTRRRS